MVEEIRIESNYREIIVAATIVRTRNGVREKGQKNTQNGEMESVEVAVVMMRVKSSHSLVVKVIRIEVFGLISK